MSSREIATQIVRGDDNFNAQFEVIEFLSEWIFDEESQIDVIEEICDVYKFTDAESFEDALLEELDAGEGELLDLIRG